MYNPWILVEIPNYFEPVYEDLWGHDHLSIVTYIVSRTLDYAGVLDNKHLRIDGRVHSAFEHDPGTHGNKYPTRLNDGTIAEYPHDDFSCLLDLIALGYAKAWTRDYEKANSFASMEIKVELTDKGLELVKELLKHRATGKSIGEYKFETP